MANTFLGIPFSVWALVCLGVAVAYLFVWPKPQASAPLRSQWTHWILRYFHSLVWVLLAIACLFWAAGLSDLAGVIALAALATYVVFMLTLVRDRKQRRTSQRESDDLKTNR